MGFMYSYKRLERLCGDALNAKKPIKAYIEEMECLPRGAYLVSGWEDDLKRLKRYLWVRNQISHNPDCSEENMSDEMDALWLDNFYERMMTQTDPLALYRKATQPHASHKQQYIPEPDTYEQSSETPVVWIVLGVLAGLIIATALIWLFLIW